MGMHAVIISIALAVALAAVGVVGDFFIKLSGNGAKYLEPKLFVAGLFIYAGTAFGWFFVMKHVKLSTLGVFYAITTVLCLVFVGTLYFKEPLNGYEVIGIALAILSLVLMGRFA